MHEITDELRFPHPEYQSTKISKSDRSLHSFSQPHEAKVESNRVMGNANDKNALNKLSLNYTIQVLTSVTSGSVH